jgi:hypothetical protein
MSLPNNPPVHREEESLDDEERAIVENAKKTTRDVLIAKKKASKAVKSKKAQTQQEKRVEKKRKVCDDIEEQHAEFLRLENEERYALVSLGRLIADIRVRKCFYIRSRNQRCKSRPERSVVGVFDLAFEVDFRFCSTHADGLEDGTFNPADQHDLLNDALRAHRDQQAQAPAPPPAALVQQAPPAPLAPQPPQISIKADPSLSSNERSKEDKSGSDNVDDPMDDDSAPAATIEITIPATTVSTGGLMGSLISLLNPN